MQCENDVKYIKFSTTIEILNFSSSICLQSPSVVDVVWNRTLPSERQGQEIQTPPTLPLQAGLPPHHDQPPREGQHGALCVLILSIDLCLHCSSTSFPSQSSLSPKVQV